ncbi:MAG: hypothetical protein AAF787_16940 [Chloroflexota bacterium]
MSSKDIRILDVDTQQLNVLDIPSSAFFLTWEPDEESITYRRPANDGSGDYYSYRYVLATETTELVSDAIPAGDGFQLWSPGDECVTRRVLNGYDDVIVTDMRTNDSRTYTGMTHNHWLHQGCGLLFMQHGQLKLLDVDTWQTESVPMPDDAIVNSLAWQPRP